MAPVLLVTLLFAVAPAPSLATKIDVGGKQRWAPNVNYTTWANQQQFYQLRVPEGHVRRGAGERRGVQRQRRRPTVQQGHQLRVRAQPHGQLLLHLQPRLLLERHEGVRARPPGIISAATGDAAAS